MHEASSRKSATVYEHPRPLGEVACTSWGVPHRTGASDRRIGPATRSLARCERASLSPDKVWFICTLSLGEGDYSGECFGHNELTS